MQVLAIGTSPLMLLRALALAQQGDELILADRASGPGGAWENPSVLGFENVETGVHLIENRSGLYAMLRNKLGIQMEGDAGQSFGLWRGRRIPIGGTRVLFHTLVAANAFRRGAFDKSRRIGISALRAAASLNVPFEYPSQGCAAMTGALVAALGRAGARLLYGVEVTRIEARGTVWAETSSGPLEVDHALISSRAHAPVVLEGNRFPVHVESSVCHNLVLHVASAREERCGYVEVLQDPAVKRMRDVGPFARPRPDAGERLLCVQLRKPETTGGKIGEQTLCHLKRLGLVQPGTQLIGASRHDFPLETITDSSLRKLNRRSEGRIEGVLTTDFADGYVSMLSAMPPAAAVPRTRSRE